MSEGRKDDGGKLRFDLLPPDALIELARVYTAGANNPSYGPRNWETGITYGRIFAALQRHSWAFWQGEENDLDDGLPHMAHAAWNCLTLLAYSLRGMGAFDDRPTTPAMSTWADVEAAVEAARAIFEPTGWRLP